MAAAGLSPGYTASFSAWIDPEASDTEDLVVLFNPVNDCLSDEKALRKAVREIEAAAYQFCRKRPTLVLPLPRHCLPKSSIGKLSRTKLKQSLLAGEFAQYTLRPSCEQLGQRRDSTRALNGLLIHALVSVLRLSDDELYCQRQLSSLGIDSIGYLRLKSTLERALAQEYKNKVTLSAARIIACRTLGDLDEYIFGEGSSTKPYDPIVELNPPGSKAPLILCHPGNGEFLIWLPLLPYLADRQVLALRARGFNEGETRFASLPEMLNAYVAAIKKHQPQGPYSLLGWCFGGLLS